MITRSRGSFQVIQRIYFLFFHSKQPRFRITKQYLFHFFHIILQSFDFNTPQLLGAAGVGLARLRIDSHFVPVTLALPFAHHLAGAVSNQPGPPGTSKLNLPQSLRCRPRPIWHITSKTTFISKNSPLHIYSLVTQ